MKINIPEIIDSSIEWEKADEKVKENFEKYLDKFFRENKGKNEVPLTFKDWLKQNIKNLYNGGTE